MSGDEGCDHEADALYRGDHSPSYIYRIIKEAYDEEDVEL